MEIEKHSFKDLLCLDVATRWNSTHKMLEAAKKCQSVYNLWKKKMGTLYLIIDRELCKAFTFKI
jgi:hypothetical protein